MFKNTVFFLANLGLLTSLSLSAYGQDQSSSITDEELVPTVPPQKIELEHLDVAGRKIEEDFDDPESLELAKLLRQNQQTSRQLEKKGGQYQELGGVVDTLSTNHKQYAVNKWDYEGKVELVNKQMACAQQKEKRNSEECKAFFQGSVLATNSTIPEKTNREKTSEEVEKEKNAQREKQEATLEYATMIYRTLSEGQRLVFACSSALKSASQGKKLVTVDFLAEYRLDRFGKAHNIQIQSPIAQYQSTLQQCVSWVLLQTTFPKPPYGEDVVIRQPIQLSLQ
jgi:hypothetical protein